MAIQGSRRLGATQQQVWEILRSPDALRRILPGLDLLEAQGADRYRWSADIQGGALSRRLEGNASVGEKHAPLGAVLTFDGVANGGAAWQGSVQLRLAEVAKASAPWPSPYMPRPPAPTSPQWMRWRRHWRTIFWPAWVWKS